MNRTQHPEPNAQTIAWLVDKMPTDTPVKLTPSQVERVKDVWEVLTLSDYTFTFNESFTKLIKRKR